MQKLIVLVILIVLSLSYITTPSLFSNDGSYGYQGNGGGVIAVKNNAVSMDSEDIKIDMTQAGFGEYTINYDCLFQFKNTTSKNQQVIMGFPLKLNTHVSGGTGEKIPTDSAVSDFTFIVDGKKTAFEINKNAVNPDMSEVPAYDVVYSVELMFKPGENKTIRNTYRMSSNYTARPNPMGGAGWSGFRNQINYILKTGLTWNGPIGTSDITITFHVPEDYIEPFGEPTDFKILENPLRIVYKFKDFKPSKDISIGFKYKKLPFEKASKQIKTYFDKQDYFTAYYLLEKWDVTTLRESKDNATKDTIRNLAYKTAEKLYKKDSTKVIDLYLTALRHAYSYDARNYFTLQYPGENGKEQMAVKDWKHEGEANSPCYYIAYNLACVYSLQNETYQAENWLNIAFAMNPNLSELSRKDKDLENLLRSDTMFITACRNKANLSDFLEKGEDVNQRGKNEQTPLMTFFEGIENMHYYEGLDIRQIRNLVAKGANLTLKDSNGLSILHYAVKALGSVNKSNFRDQCYSEFVEIINLLVQSGADINAKDKNGSTPLAYSFSCLKTIDEVKIRIIELSPQIDIPANDGSTALMKAARSYSVAVVRALLDKGANVNAVDNAGDTPLMWACSGIYRSTAIIDLLIKKGAKVNARDKTGKTALIKCLDSGNNMDATTIKDIVQSLLKAGADPGIRDLSGMDAKDVALRTGNEYVFVTDYKPSMTVLDKKTVLLSSRDRDMIYARIRDMKRHENRLFVLYEWGWVVFDISALPECKLIADYYYMHGYDSALNRFDIAGDYLYAIGNSDAYLHIFSIKDIEKPVEVKKMRINDCGVVQPSGSLIARDGYLYLIIEECYWHKDYSCKVENRIICFSLADMTNPKRVSETAVDFGEIHSYGDYFVIHGFNEDKSRLSIISLKEKSKPRIVMSLDTGLNGTATHENDIFIDNDQLFIPYFVGLAVYTIRMNSSNVPEITKKIDITKPGDIKFEQNYFVTNVFVKNHIASSQTLEYFLDLTDLGNIKFIKPESYENRLPTLKVVDCGDYVICCTSNQEIMIYDMKNPKKPNFIKKYTRDKGRYGKTGS